MALPDSRLDELCRVASTTGNDPALDSLLLRLHMETACRRGGALALVPDDLDPVTGEPHPLAAEDPAGGYARKTLQMFV